jgi:hypothetical protein
MLALLALTLILAPVAGLAQAGGDDDGYGYGYGSEEGWFLEIGRGTVLESGNFEFAHQVPAGLEDRYDIYAVGTANDGLPVDTVVARVTPADRGNDLPLLITNLEPESTVSLEARADAPIDALTGGSDPADTTSTTEAEAPAAGGDDGSEDGTSTTELEEALSPGVESSNNSNTTRGLIGLGVAGLILIGAAGYAISLTNRAKA